MRHYKTSAFKLCVAIGVVFGTTTATLACGNALLYPLLFRVYPQAKVAYDAELDARRQGRLSVPSWSRDLGSTYHQWSLARAEKAVKELGTRLHAKATSQEAKGTSSIKLLLTNEIYTAQIEPQANKATLEPLRTGRSERPADLYTSANVIRALLDGKLKWPEAVDKKLVVFGNGERVQSLSALLWAALSKKDAETH